MNDIYSRYMQNVNISRCEALGRYIADSKDTVRGAARVFGVSKSTVHKDDGVIIGTVKGNAKKH